MNKHITTALSIIIIIIACFAIGKLYKSYQDDSETEKQEQIEEHSPKENENNQNKDKENAESEDKTENKNGYVIKEPAKDNSQNKRQTDFEQGFSEVGGGGSDSYKITTSQGKVKNSQNDDKKVPSQNPPQDNPQPENNTNSQQNKDNVLDPNAPLEFDDMIEESFINSLDDMGSEDFFSFEFGGFE